ACRRRGRGRWRRRARPPRGRAWFACAGCGCAGSGCASWSGPSSRVDGLAVGDRFGGGGGLGGRRVRRRGHRRLPLPSEQPGGAPRVAAERCGQAVQQDREDHDGQSGLGTQADVDAVQRRDDLLAEPTR
ncbi:hypothetical protein COO01_31685, partial [Bacillus toyonensis]